MGDVLDLETVKRGLLNDPKHVSEHLQWLTDEGHKLFAQRQKSTDFYDREKDVIGLASRDISKNLDPHEVLVIDLGAGKTDKAILFLKSLVADFPNRKICYVPIDISSVVLEWKQYLKDELPTLSDHVEVFPIKGDIIQSLESLDDSIPEPYRGWMAVFTIFGPNIACFPNEYAVKMVEKVSTVCSQRGNGRFLITYIAVTNQMEKNMQTTFFDKINMEGMGRSILLGLNKVSDANLDTSAFDISYSIKHGMKTPNVDGTWSGYEFLATAKCDTEFTCAKLGQHISLKEGDTIRLSEDPLKDHYYEENYLRSLAKKYSFEVEGNWVEDTNLLSCIGLKMPEK